MNRDNQEIEKFDALHNDWWDKTGKLRTLHWLNPLRIQFITDQVPVTQQKIIDVGCGGGILTESFAVLGSQMTGIDLSIPAIDVAKKHATTMSLSIDYHVTHAEIFASQHRESFDHVVCMELLEHVPDPQSLIKACATLVKPGGYVFFSTINRNPKAYLFAVLAAEYLLRLLPCGTHDYAKFITPAELEADCRAADLIVEQIKGFTFNPITKQFRFTEDISVNYLLSARRSGTRSMIC